VTTGEPRSDMHYYKNTFVVSVGNSFMVSVRGTDTFQVTPKMRCL
jgi:hypothetical protein